MRIQHNIMAMNAYRNYSNNVSAMKSNLEKLSSGYKINRAGDDAAGLAISEKMRAQITGLETAQKNAKDGISLVQTAEGALTEVHDMLNRMVELASQSANGTYDGTDREQLQKEVNQLMDEINRIADSSNFNGIKLLDGSMSSDAVKITGDARIISDVYTSGNAASLSGTKTFLDGEVATPETATKFVVDFKGLTAKLGASAAPQGVFTADETGVTGVTATVNTADTGDGNITIDIETVTAAKATSGAVADGALKGATFGYNQDGAAGNFTIKLVGGGDADAAAWDADNNTLTITLNKAGGATTGELTAAELQTKIQALTATGTSAPDCSKITVANTFAANLDATSTTPASVTLAGGADAGKKVTLTNGDADEFEKTFTNAEWNGTVNVAGDNGVSVAITTGSITTDVTAGPLGSVATPAPDTDVDFSFKIGNTTFTGAQAADGDDETAIADAVEDALDAAADADGNVEINGIKYSYVNNGDGTIEFTLEDTPTNENIAANYDWDVTGVGTDSFDGNHTAGVTVTTPGSVYKDAPVANTVFKLESSDIKDGTKITIDGTTVTLAVGKNSAYKTEVANGTVDAAKGGNGYIDLTWMEEGSVDLNQAISAISEGFKNGTSNFIVGTNDTSNGDTHAGLTVHKDVANSTETYDTKAKLASVFEIEKAAGGGLRLQIGDTADTYNQLKVSISDCHATSLGISGVDISTQDGASSAIDAIKAAINKVSDVRGTLGATQNRLDHTINNLSVMTENIQDAESTIRDVDVAEEMMAYTKNNILIQSAQAMLAQANQVPQGVLQLLQ